MSLKIESCPKEVQLLVLSPQVKELDEIEIDGYNAQTMMYKMIHEETPQNREVASYYDTKRYDPTVLPEGVVNQVASPISSLFALSNKKSRQKRKLNQYRREMQNQQERQKDSIQVAQALEALPKEQPVLETAPEGAEKIENSTQKDE